MKNTSLKPTLAFFGTVLLLSMNSAQAGGFSQNNLPGKIQVPEGNKVAFYTSAKGNITWQCKQDPKNAGKAAWAFAGPRAILTDKSGNHLVSYFGPPATWASLDGSSVTGKQLAVSPSGKGSIPMQLVKANPAKLSGQMTGITYIQRINLKGGAAPVKGCSKDKVGHKVIVNYSGDYIFWEKI